ncbi:MAG: hypothetical protein WAK56_09595 [Candidatus Sulfotelmatobacter sp.]
MLDIGLRRLRGRSDYRVPGDRGGGHDAKHEQSGDKNCKTKLDPDSLSFAEQHNVPSIPDQSHSDTFYISVEMGMGKVEINEC